MEVSGQLLNPAALTFRYPLDITLGGPQSRSGRGDERKEYPTTAPADLQYVI
jgi:hypothetical protein